MFEELRVAVIVPAHDEAQWIRTTLESIPEYVDWIVVVDDGSRDTTFEVASNVTDSRISILRHRVNHGVGAAILTGYLYAFEVGADIAVVMAGDGQMDPHDLPTLLKPIVGRHAGYVKGNRLHWPNAKREMPFLRWFGNHALSRLTRWAIGFPINDSQCGYTALSREAASRIALDELWPRYGYPNHLLGMLAEKSVQVKEVVVRPIYRNEASGVRFRDALLVIPFLLVREAWRQRRTLPQCG